MGQQCKTYLKLEEGLLYICITCQASLVAQIVKYLPQCRRPGFHPWVGKIPWRKSWQPTPVFWPGESPWREHPGGLQFMGSLRVRHNWVTKHTVSSVLGWGFSGIWIPHSFLLARPLCLRKAHGSGKALKQAGADPGSWKWAGACWGGRKESGWGIDSIC